MEAANTPLIGVTGNNSSECVMPKCDKLSYELGSIKVYTNFLFGRHIRASKTVGTFKNFHRIRA